MFGLKVVKNTDYLELKEQLDLYMREAVDKGAEVAQLEGTVRFLNNKVSELEKQIKDLQKTEKDVKSEVVLLSDVAEEPLTVAKPVKKPRKTVKKTDETATRKKVVHKSETKE